MADEKDEAERVSCINCLYRSKKPFGNFEVGAVKFLCHRNPPQMVGIGDYDAESNRMPARALFPIIHQYHWCGHFVDRDSKRSLDAIQGVE